MVQVQSLPSTFDAAMCIFNAHLLSVLRTAAELYLTDRGESESWQTHTY